MQQLTEQLHGPLASLKPAAHVATQRDICQRLCRFSKHERVDEKMFRARARRMSNEFWTQNSAGCFFRGSLQRDAVKGGFEGIEASRCNGEGEKSLSWADGSRIDEMSGDEAESLRMEIKALETIVTRISTSWILRHPSFHSRTH